MTAETGMVRIHAQKIFRVTPHFTAATPFLAPTPMIAPVIVCVVLTGIPKAVAMNSVIEPAVSAQTPSNGFSLVIFCPMVFTILQPPNKVPNAMAPLQLKTIHKAMGVSLVACAVTINATQMMPMDFCASFPPWPRLKAEAEKIWIFRKTESTFAGVAL